MKASRRYGLWLAALAGLANLASGCNILTTAFYVFGPEEKNQAECKRLASDDKKKAVKAVVITSMGLETRPEFLRVDRELHGHLHRALMEGFNRNEELVTLLPARTIEKFKDENPSWQMLTDEEIGKRFHADYVVRVEIESISIFEHGSGNQLYRGKIEGHASVFDTSKADDYPTRKDFSIVYPGSKGPIPVGDSNPQQFKNQFLAHVGKRLSWFFTAHPTEDGQKMLD